MIEQRRTVSGSGTSRRPGPRTFPGGAGSCDQLVGDDSQMERDVPVAANPFFVDEYSGLNRAEYIENRHSEYNYSRYAIVLYFVY